MRFFADPPRGTRYRRYRRYLPLGLGPWTHGGEVLDRLSNRLPLAPLRGQGGHGVVHVPVFSPHDLRHRRISLLHRQGRTWAEIGRFVGQRKLSVQADTYTHVLSDGREADYLSLVT